MLLAACSGGESEPQFEFTEARPDSQSGTTDEPGTSGDAEGSDSGAGTTGDSATDDDASGVGTGRWESHDLGDAVGSVLLEVDGTLVAAGWSPTRGAVQVVEISPDGEAHLTELPFPSARRVAAYLGAIEPAVQVSSLGGSRVTYWIRERQGAWASREFPPGGLPSDVLTRARTQSGNVVVGAIPIATGSAAAAWIADGDSWDRTVPPRGQGVMYLAAATADHVMIGGSIDSRDGLFFSLDGGRSYERVSSGGIPGIEPGDRLTTYDGDFVLASSPSRAVELRVTGDGRNWLELPLPDEVENRGVADPRFHDVGGRLVMVGLGPLGDEICSADLHRCQRGGLDVALYDGVWRYLDDTAWHEFGAPTAHVDSLALGDGLALLVSSGPSQARVHIWRGLLGAASTVDIGSATPDGPEPLAGQDPEPGVEYFVRLPLDCTVEIRTESRRFVLEEPSFLPASAPGQPAELPEGWPVVSGSIPGYVTLVGDDTLEFELPTGDVVATFSTGGGRSRC